MIDHGASVTEFDEISPKCLHFKSLWQFFESLFCIGKIFEPNWANFYDIEQILVVADGPILKR